MPQLTNSPAVHSVLQLEYRQSFSLNLAFESVEPEGPLNITDHTLQFSLGKPLHLGGTNLITRELTLSDAVNGKARLDLQADDIDTAILGVKQGEFPFVITMTTPEGFSLVVVKGTANVLYNPDPGFGADFSPVSPPLSLTARLRDLHVVSVKISHYPFSSLRIGTVTTLSPGAPATAELDGSYPVQTLNLGIPASAGSTPVEIDYVENHGVPAGIDDSVLFQAAVTAVGTTKILRLKPGVTYRAHGITVPTGTTIDARGATVKVPDGVTAGNIFTASGAWTLIGGTFDGNKAGSADPGSITSGNGVYQYAAGGWAGTVRLVGQPVFKNCWSNGIHGATDLTALTDGANAPAAAMFIDQAEVTACTLIGIRVSGLRGVTMDRIHSHHNTSHNGRAFLCREITVTDGNFHDSSAGHGFSSLYCYDQEFSGRYNDNHTDGLVFGGDASSTTNQPGRYIRCPYLECNGNDNIGLCFDATITALHNPVPVWAQVGIVHADGNTNEGVIVNSSQWVWFDSVFTDSNGGHGISFASRNCGFGFHHAHSNGQKPLALQGNSTDPNWGQHWIGQRDYAGNTPDDTNTIGTVLADSTWVLVAVSNDTPPTPPLVFSARKQVDTSRLSNTALTADPELTLLNLPIGEYTGECFFIYDSSTTADLATSWNLPTGTVIAQGFGGLAGTATVTNPAVINEGEFATAAGPVLGGVGVGTLTFSRASIYLKVTTAGTLTFKWAQNTTDATNTTLRAGSWMKFTKIA